MSDLVRLLDPSAGPRIGQALAGWLPDRRWFQGKARTVTTASVVDLVLLDDRVLDVFLDVAYVDGGNERYQVPLTAAHETTPHGSFDVDGVPLVDALADEGCCRILAGLVTTETVQETARGRRIIGRPVTGRAPGPADRPRLLSAEQSNSSVVFGQRHILKVLRRLEAGTHPDVELTRGLTEAGFAHVPAQHGSCELESTGSEPTALAVLADFVAGGREGWQLARDEAVAVARGASPTGTGLIDQLPGLGDAVAGVHEALADTFGARRAGTADVAEWAGQMRAQIDRVLDLAGRRAPDAAAEVLERSVALTRATEEIAGLGDGGPLQRIHGDLHLGQVLLDPEGSWQLLDFEGEPARSLQERRAPSSPLRDVAGMLRSFDYAAAAGAMTGGADGRPLPERLATWRDEARRRFLFAYLERARALLPQPETTALLLAAFELDKAVYELGYELANRPTWVPIPVGGIVRVLETRQAGRTAQNQEWE